MSVLGRLKDGDMLIAGNLNERMPAVTNGLVAHFPFDGAGGTFDIVGGFQPIQHTTENLNLFDAMNLDWRDPKSWASYGSGTINNMSWDEDKQALKIVGNNYLALRTPIKVDVNKHYYITAEVYQEKADGDGTHTNVLYLGGRGTTSTGANYTTNYDYSIKSYYDVPLGQWITVSRNRYGSGSQVNGADGGWTSTNGLCVNYYFGGLFNYYGASTDVIYIRNISIVVTDADNSNCTFTYDGVAVEQTTTNLMGDVMNLSIVDNSGFFSATAYGNTYNNHPITKVKKLAGTPSGWSSLRRLVNISASTSYTISWKLKVLFGNLNSIGRHWGGGTSASVSYYYLSDGWYQFYFTATTDSSWTAVNTGVGFVGTDAGEFLITDPQMEQSTFFTSYINGSRTANGMLDLPSNIMSLTEGSIAFKFTPTPGFFNANWKRLVGISTAMNRNEIEILRDTSSNNISFAISNTSGTWMNSTYRTNIVPITITAGTEYFVCARWSKSGGSYSLTVNDTTISSTWDTAAEPSVLGTLTVGYHPNDTARIMNSTIKDLSFYNRLLTDDEVSKLYKNNFQLKSTGDLQSVIVKEKPAIPSDAYYFPLAVDGKDQYGIIAPSEETNIVYENGAWVGSAMTNLLYDSGVFNGSFGTLDSTIVSTVIQPDYKYRLSTVTSTNGSTRFYIPLTKLTNGQSYNLSYKYQQLTDPNNYFNMADWNDTSISNIVKKNIGRYKYASAYGTRTTYDSTFRFMDFYFPANGVIDIYEIQLENKAFASPFCIGTRSAGNLEYNLNSSIGLDWNGDWSLVYWKKPIGTYDNTLTAYNLESIGCNSNSVGGGYIYWGKNNSTNTLGFSGNSTFTFTNYFNLWHMVSVVKIGTVIYFKFWNIDGTVKTTSYAVGAITSNRFVTQYGYDFKIGGWDNGYASNSYYKDLIVAKRVLTDTELQTIYSTQMRNYNNGNILQVRNQLIEYTGF